MDEITKKIQKEMKSTMKDKTECMLDSYLMLLKEVDRGIKSVLHENNIDKSEILKRTDMFWHTALQKIEKEQAEAKRQTESSQQIKTAITPNGITMEQMEAIRKGQVSTTESPCAKKARESAEKVAILEAQIIKDKEGKK